MARSNRRRMSERSHQRGTVIPIQMIVVVSIGPHGFVVVDATTLTTGVPSSSWRSRRRHGMDALRLVNAQHSPVPAEKLTVSP